MKKIKKISMLTIIFITLSLTKTLADTGIINTSALRLREEPNTTSDVITNIYEDEEVEILEEHDEWYKVKYNSNVGYLKKEFITKKENSNNKIDSTSNITNNTSNSNIDNDNIANEVPNTENTSSSNSLDNNLSDNSNALEDSKNIQNTEENSKIITNTIANVRLLPSIMSKITNTFEIGKELTKILEIGTWVQVTDGTVSGWILKEKVSENQNNIDNSIEQNDNENSKISEDNELVNNDKTTSITNINKKGIVNVETAKVRNSASITSAIVGFLDYNDEVIISDLENDWYKITSGEISGYVNKSLININSEEGVTSRSLVEDRKNNEKSSIETIQTIETIENIETQENSDNSNKPKEMLNFANVADYAMQFLGYPYVVGGKTPTSGFDCSGFTRYVFLNFGYTLGTTASSQSNVGIEVTKENLKSGDLLLFYDEGKTKIGHTGIYIGDGNFIHAANPTRGVVIDNINTSSYYKERFVNARRIVE